MKAITQSYAKIQRSGAERKSMRVFAVQASHN